MMKYIKPQSSFAYIDRGFQNNLNEDRIPVFKQINVFLIRNPLMWGRADGGEAGNRNVTVMELKNVSWFRSTLQNDRLDLVYEIYELYEQCVVFFSTRKRSESQHTQVNLMIAQLHTVCPHCPDFLVLILAFFLPLQWINLRDGSDLSRSVD